MKILLISILSVGDIVENTEESRADAIVANSGLDSSKEELEEVQSAIRKKRCK